MVDDLLDHALQISVSRTHRFFSFYKIKQERFIHDLWAFILLALVAYEIIVANSALCASLAIYHLISNARSWNNC